MGTKTLHLPASAATGGIALPKRAENAILQEQAEMLEQMHDVTGRLAYFTRELQERFDDPYLKVILARPHTTVEGLRPNHYHVIRFEPGKPVAIMPVVTSDGEWMDLNGSVFEMVAKADLQNDRTQRLLREEREAAERGRLREKARRAMDRAGDFDDRLDHAINPRISVPRSI